MMQDQRTKQTGLTITLLAQNFRFIICGDSEDTVSDFALHLNQHNIWFKIFWVSESKTLPEKLKAHDALTEIVNSFPFHETEPGVIVFLAFKNNKDTETYREELKQEKIICINLISDMIQGNAAIPISFATEGLEVSIHSSGRVDRKARALSDYILRQTQILTDVTLLVIGTDHQLLNLEDREPYHLQSPRYESIAAQLSVIAGIQEFFVINTCNRVEVYAMASRHQTTIQVLNRLLNFDHLREDQYYIKYDTNAFTHMCLVLCGLLSQVPGESHVVQQMKKSVDLAKSNKWAGGLLQQVFDNALFVSKHTRQKTSPHLTQLEIEDLSTRYTHESAKHIENKTIVILGAGVVGQGLIERILPYNPKEIILVYRTRIPDISKYKDLKVSLLQTNLLNQVLPKADTIFSAVSTSRFVLHSAHADYFKKHTPVLIIDICVPRSIDHHIQNECHNVCIADIESIKKWYLNIAKDIETVKNIGLNEIVNRTGRYEKILDKEWLQEQ